MDSRSYIKLTGNLTNITGTTGTTCTYAPYIEPYKTCIINIGYWNMNQSGDLVRIGSTGIPLAKIKDFSAIIKSDAGELFRIEKNSSNWESAGYVKICNTLTNNAKYEVGHNDAGSSFFRQSAFDGSVSNRGWMSILYSNIQKPSGITGTVAGVTPTYFTVNNNKVTSKGGSPLIEHGVIWSTSSVPTISNGTKISALSDIGENVPYTKVLNPVPDSTMIYFRQYACNCEEIGYANVCCQLTPALPPVTATTANLVQISTSYNYNEGCIDFNPPLTAGKCVALNMYYQQTVVSVSRCSCIQMFCRPNGYPSWNCIEITGGIEPDNCLRTLNTYQSYQNGGGGGTIPDASPMFSICCGDTIFYRNYTDGDSSSCSCFRITNAVPPTNLSVTIGSNNYDCIAIT